MDVMDLNNNWTNIVNACGSPTFQVHDDGYCYCFNCKCLVDSGLTEVGIAQSVKDYQPFLAKLARRPTLLSQLSLESRE